MAVGLVVLSLSLAGWALGRAAEARREFETALALNPNFEPTPPRWGTNERLAGFSVLCENRIRYSRSSTAARDHGWRFLFMAARTVESKKEVRGQKRHAMTDFCNCALGVGAQYSNVRTTPAIAACPTKGHVGKPSVSLTVLVALQT